MGKMIEKVWQTIRTWSMIPEGGHVIVGVSGGADSVVLLYVLHALAPSLELKLTAVHVNHGLRGEASNEDEAFVKNLCRKLQIPLKIYSADVRQLSKDSGRSLEEAGRDFRYQCFFEVLAAEGADRIAVAHHRDDVCETVLMNLCRGTGIRGLAGIPAVNGQVIRPLIDISRAEIEVYAAAHHLSYCQDATNEARTYTRNRFRHDVLPYLTAYVNSEAVRHIADVSRDAARISDYLMAEADRLSQILVQHEDGRLKIRAQDLLKLPGILQAELVLKLLGEAAGRRRDISRNHVEAVLKLADGRTGQQADLPYGLCAVKEYEYLLIYKKEKRTEDSVTDEIRVNAPCSHILLMEGVEIPCKKGLFRLTMTVGTPDKNGQIPKKRYTKWFDYDRMSHRLTFRKRRSGDYLRLSDGSRKKLNRLLIDEKVSRTDRDQLMLLADEDHVVWIPALDRISDDLKITGQTTHILEIQLEEITDERKS